MGIDGLHNLIKPCLQSVNLSSLKVKSAAIDALCYLYKGCYSVAYELNNNIPTKGYMFVLLRLARMIKNCGINPIIVFDGRTIQSKSLTIDKRVQLKQSNFDKANNMVQQGNMSEADYYFKRSLFVTQEMVYDTIDVLRANNIDFLVAPYETDSQISFMVRKKQVDIAITEDSDLLCFGCPRIAFKIKADSSCEFFDDSLFQTTEQRKSLKSEPLRCFLSLPNELRTMACIMAGCDYVPSIQGIGIKTSSYLFYNLKDFKQVMKRLRSESKTRDNIPNAYDTTVEKVSLIFRYQRVFNRETNRLETLNPLPEEFSKEDYILIGEIIPDFKDVAIGKRDIKTLSLREEKSIDMKSYFAQEKKWMPWNVEKPKEQLTPTQKQMKRIENNRIAEAAAVIRKKWNSEQIQKHNFISLDDQNNLKDCYNNPLKQSKEEEYNEDYLLSLLDKFQDSQDDGFGFQEQEAAPESENIEKNQLSERKIETPLTQEQQAQANSYLEYLCNSFVKDYMIISSENVANSVRYETVVTRNINGQNEENININQNKSVPQPEKLVSKFKQNPFAIKQQQKAGTMQLSTEQPDSLDDLNPNGNVDAKAQSTLPEKKKSILPENVQQGKISRDFIQIDSPTPKKPKVILTDFFVSKKKTTTKKSIS